MEDADDLGLYTYKRATYVINIANKMFYSPGLYADPATFEPGWTEIRLEDDDSVLFLKNLLEGELGSPVYLFSSGKNITFEVKQKTRGPVPLPVMPGANLQEFIPLVNRDMYFKRGLSAI